MKRVPNGYLSVGDITKITSLSRATVQRWILRGDLKVAYVLPSEIGHAKITVKELRRFLRENQMPTVETFLKMHRIDVSVEKVALDQSKTTLKQNKAKR